MKKFVTFLCAALLVVGVVACKKEEVESTDTVVTDTVATDTASVTTETTQTTTISAETETSAQSSTDNAGRRHSTDADVTAARRDVVLFEEHMKAIACFYRKGVSP